MCVVEGGALVVKAGGADGVLDHVELLQLKRHRIETKRKSQGLSEENISVFAAYWWCILCHLVREGIGLPQSQLLIVEGVAKYAAHHRNVLEEERQIQNKCQGSSYC